MPHFDSSINLGTLVALGVTLFTFYKFHMANVKRFMTIEFQVAQMWGVFRRRFNIDKDTNFFPGDKNED